MRVLLDTCTFLWVMLLTPDPEIQRYPVRTLW
jgi:PIN domain nuclease of toxin-antitoxin system